MNIKPSKFHNSQRVKFGGCIIEANSNNNSVEISPDPKKVDELLGRELDMSICRLGLRLRLKFEKITFDWMFLSQIRAWKCMSYSKVS